MNYYQHHIGDFNSATRYLTLVERALYRDLIEMYYDTEQAIVASDFERLAKRLLCKTEDEKTALKYVLSEFFTLEDGYYYQSRCEREIAEYQAKKEQQVKAGRASAAKRVSSNKAAAKDATNDHSTSVQPQSNDRSTNHKPITNNQEPSNQILNPHTQETCEEKNSLGESWKPNRENLLNVIRTSIGVQAESAINVPDYEFHLGNFNAHWENKIDLTENQRTRKFAAWLIQEFKKSNYQEKPSHFKNSRQPEKPKHKYGTGVVQPDYQQEQMRDVSEVNHG